MNKWIGYVGVGLLGAFLAYGAKTHIDNGRVEKNTQIDTINKRTNRESLRRLFEIDKSSDVFEKLDEKIACSTYDTMCSKLQEIFNWERAAKAIFGRQANVTPRQAAEAELLKHYTRL